MARLGSPAAFLPSPLPPTLDGHQAADQMAPVTDLWFGSPSCTNTAGWHSTIADASGLQNDRVALPIQVWQCRGRGLVAHSNRELAMCVLSGCVERVPVQLVDPPPGPAEHQFASKTLELQILEAGLAVYVTIPSSQCNVQR